MTLLIFITSEDPFLFATFPQEPSLNDLLSDKKKLRCYGKYIVSTDVFADTNKLDP